MTEPVRPDAGTTIEDIPPSAWDQTAPVPNQLSTPAPEAPATAAPGRRGRNSLRWLVALVGVVVVVGASAVVVSLAAGRPTPSIAMGYMPASTLVYAEARLDLPGDQRQKLGEFLKNALPGFDDQAQLDAKLDDVFDRLVKSASKDKQTWTTDIKPWFGGQIALGVGLPDVKALGASTSAQSTVGGGGTGNAVSAPAMAGMDNVLFAVSIKDRAKAGAWLTSVVDAASTNHSTYNGADLYVNADAPGGGIAVAITDKVMLGGTQAAVKAAVDTNGNSSFGANDDVKAALASIDQDNVGFSLVRTKAAIDGVIAMVGSAAAGALDKTQIDETLLSMIPAWQSSTIRFENDALAFSHTSPPWSIGYDATNHKSGVLGHLPAKTVAYAEVHDVGPALSALLGKFRALPEAKGAFDSIDQAMALLGGFDGVFGWWGDAALAVSPGADGTIGAGLVVQANDPAAAKRLLGVLTADLQLAGGSTGLAVRTEDHNGTTITIADFSGVSGVDLKGLPAGYKPEIAWAANDSVAVVGYGRDFVAAVLDAGPGNSLADDARFKSLLGRVGTDNISSSFVDISGIRALVEPLIQKSVTADKWANYQEYKPYFEHFDALINAVRKDGGIDRGSGQLTVH